MPKGKKGGDQGDGNKSQGNPKSIKMIDKPQNKKSKFKKDFNQGAEKLLAKIKDEFEQDGVLNMEGKKVKFVHGYGKADKVARFEQDKPRKDDETITFTQNKHKKGNKPGKGEKNPRDPYAGNRKAQMFDMEAAQIEHIKRNKGALLFKESENDEDDDDDIIEQGDIFVKGKDLIIDDDDAVDEDDESGIEDEMVTNEEEDDDEEEEEAYLNSLPKKNKFPKKLLQEADKKREKQSNKKKFQGYDDYLDMASIQKGLKKGKLFQGVYIRNERNPMNSFIKSPALEDRAFFKDLRDENRAMHNSVVIFEIMTKNPRLVKNDKQPTSSKPKRKQSDEEEKQMEFSKNQQNLAESEGEFTDEDDLIAQEQMLIQEEEKFYQNEEDDEDFVDDDELDDDEYEFEDDILENIPLDSEDEDDDTFQNAPVQNDSDLEFPEGFDKAFNRKKNKKKSQNNKQVKGGKKKEDEQEQKRAPKMYARVVFVVDNPQYNRRFVVTLKRIWPENPNSPIKAIPIEKQLPAFDLVSFYPKSVAEMNSYYLAEYINWPKGNRMPYGHVIEQIGDQGLVEVESEALLRNYGVYNAEFSLETKEEIKEIEKKLDPETNLYVIPESERKRRLDLTKEIVYTCDPATARDLDDALSIKDLGDGTYEIGVHIADVSYFVKEGSAIDDDARLRTTTVYLVQRAIPMLPHLLCQNLCSLNPGVERLTFSCFFKVKEDGTVLEVQEPKISESIIKTAVRFSYEQVQDIIEGKTTNPDDLPICYMPEGHTAQDVLDVCLKMNSIAQKIRQRRLDTGSLTFDKSKLSFKLDDSNYPIATSQETRKEANFMVEEYMLLANKFVGKFLVEKCSDYALLRNHPKPSQKKIADLEKFLAKLGLKMNFESSLTLKESSSLLFQDDSLSKELKDLIKVKMVRLQEAAKYFIIEETEPEDWWHYALNFDIYTHFTSPIRRYPDVLVHRLAKKCLKYQDDVQQHINKFHMLSIMDKCNECKINSRRVSDGASRLFMCLYLRNNPYYTTAIPTFMGTAFIELYIPDIGCEKKIVFKELKSFVKAEQKNIDIDNLDTEMKKVTVEFNLKEIKKPIKIEFNELQPIPVFVTATETSPIDFKVVFLYEHQGQKIKIE